MGQMIHKFKAETFDEAYQLMVRTLGRNAVVVNTTEVSEGGVFGLLGRKMIELTASAPTDPAPPRRRSLPEKKYEAQRPAPIGSDETVSDTVEFFKQVVADAQARMAKHAGAAPEKSETPSAVATAPEAPPAGLEDLQREIREMRETMQVLIAETPAAGLPPSLRRSTACWSSAASAGKWRRA